MSNLSISIPYLDVKRYHDAENWSDFLKSSKNLDNIPFDNTWIILFSLLRHNKKYNTIIEKLKEDHKKGKIIYPKPKYIFSSFLACPASKLKVVILGQDPYPKSEDVDNITIPQACGMSFSVPDGVTIPSSLNNIFHNLKKFGHIDAIPENGNLWFWAVQGCLMLNTALTVRHNEVNSHADLWLWMTNEMITYISKYFNGIVFLLWGSFAYSKIELIDQDKHHVIVSSHPSGLSANKPFRNFPSFSDCDHFGETNRILTLENKDPIIWNTN